MKTCGYCGRTYDDSEPRCPSCGSTLIKISHDADPAAIEYDRIKREIKNKRRTRSLILIGIGVVIIVAVIIIIISSVSRANDPQNIVDSSASDAYQSALEDVNAGKYDSALNTLNSIDTSWSDYNKVTELKQRTVSEMLKDRASTYMDNGDYEAILRLFDSDVDISGDAELKSIYDSAASKYRDQVIKDAENAYKSNGYQAAFSVVNDGLSLLNGDSLLQSEKDKYASFAPVDLTSISPYFEGSISVFTSSKKDITGKSYSTGIYGYLSPSDSEYHDCYNIWDIGGKYNKLTATGIVFEDNKGSSNVGSYKIYGDGVILFEKSNIGSTTKPYQIEVDITGVTDLKIEMYGGGNMGWQGIDAVLANVMLQRTK